MKNVSLYTRDQCRLELGVECANEDEVKRYIIQGNIMLNINYNRGDI